MLVTVLAVIKNAIRHFYNKLNNETILTFNFVPNKNLNAQLNFNGEKPCTCSDGNTNFQFKNTDENKSSEEVDDFLTEIVKLLGKGRMRETIDRSLNFCQGRSVFIYFEINILKFRFVIIESRESIGLINWKKAQTEKEKICRTLLNLIHSLKN